MPDVQVPQNGAEITGEVLISPLALCIQDLSHPFRILNGRTDVHFQKIILPDNIRRHFADIVAGTDKGGNRYNARIYKQFGNLGYATDVFYTVGFRKPNYY